eukprot:3186540-Rhodomonas_salina.1
MARADSAGEFSAAGLFALRPHPTIPRTIPPPCRYSDTFGFLAPSCSEYVARTASAHTRPKVVVEWQMLCLPSVVEWQMLSRTIVLLRNDAISCRTNLKCCSTENSL